MNSLFVKTAEACIPLYRDENGESRVNYHSTACNDYADGRSSSVWPDIIPLITLVIFGIIFFFLIKRRKNISKKSVRIINLIGIILTGFLFLVSFPASVHFLINLF